MNLNKKRTFIFLILTVICIFFITRGIIKTENKAVITPQPVVEKTATEKKQESRPVNDVSKKKKFISNEEIKNEYGKLETVTLWNGKSYTGAVINTEEVYSIITVDGLINIPMKEVKIREIIR